MEFHTLLQLANVARKDIELLVPDYYPDNLCSACGSASYHLMRLANLSNIYPTFVGGYFIREGNQEPNKFFDGHCWIEYQNYIIDLTATQFGSYPDINVVAKNDYHYSVFDFRSDNQYAVWDDIKSWAMYPRILRNLSSQRAYG